MSNIVAIVGRPNVGKSTLFNRLVKRRDAIVDSVSGVTRDRHYGKSDWNGKEFSVIDTGGYAIGSGDVFEEEIRKQVQLAIDEADHIIFVVECAARIWQNLKCRCISTNLRDWLCQSYFINSHFVF